MTDRQREAVARALANTAGANPDREEWRQYLDDADDIIAAYEATQRATDASDLERVRKAAARLPQKLRFLGTPFEQDCIDVWLASITDARQAAAREMRERCLEIVSEHSAHRAQGKDCSQYIAAAINALPDNA